MSTFNLGIILGATAGIFNFLGAFALVSKKRPTPKALNVISSVGAGALLGVAMLEIIPQSVKSLATAPFYIIGGYILIHLFEHTLSSHFHFGEENHPDQITPKVNFSILVALLVHTFLEGAAIVAGLLVNPLLGWLIFAGIIIHKISDGVTIASVVSSLGREKQAVYGSAFIVALATVAGAIFTTTFNHLGPYILAVSGGALIYIATTDLVPEINRRAKIFYTFLMLSGIGLYLLSKLIFIKMGIGG